MVSKLHNNPSYFGSQLKALRRKKFKTQASFADALDVSIESVRNWEQGRQIPTPHHLFIICQLLDCDIDFLIGRLDQKTHDVQFIHDQTGLSEEAITQLEGLNPDQTALVSRIIEHPDFLKVIKQMQDISDKAAISRCTASMIVSSISDRLNDQSSVAVHADMIEKAMLFSISNLFTQIVCDVTDTDL